MEEEIIEEVESEEFEDDSEFEPDYDEETSEDDTIQTEAVPIARTPSDNTSTTVSISSAPLASTSTMVVTTRTNSGFQVLLRRLREQIDSENRLNPWCFQNDPRWGPNEERPQPVEDTEGRLGNAGWCNCGKCKPMTHVEESICCKEYLAMEKMLENVSCITENEDFIRKVLDRQYLIELIQYDMELNQREFEINENRHLRRTGYKKFIAMAYGFLGKGHRIPIPSCVVCKIRDTYPDPNGNYTGFKWSGGYVTGSRSTHLNI